MPLSKNLLHRVDKVIELARALKPLKATGKPFHVTACYRKSRLVALGWNDYRHFHPAKRFGKYVACKPETVNPYIAGRHSEIAAIMNAGFDDFSDIVFINVRINNMDKVDIAKPCPNCLRVLTEQLHFKTIIYTRPGASLGIIRPNQNEQIYSA